MIKIDALKTQPEKIEFLRRYFCKDLYSFTRYCLGYPDINKETHLEICQTLQSESKRKLVCVPRGCLKSTICSVSYPIWLLCRNPNDRIMLDSQIYTNSCLFLREIKAQMKSNELLKSLWGEWEGSIWADGEIIIKQRTQAKKESSIFCSGVGTSKTGLHMDHLIIDDLSSEKNSLTDDNRKKTLDHYRMSVALLEPEGSLSIVGTRYHESDIIGHVLANEIFNSEKELQDFIENA